MRFGQRCAAACDDDGFAQMDTPAGRYIRRYGERYGSSMNAADTSTKFTTNRTAR
jgi:hypothetical protein